MTGRTKNSQHILLAGAAVCLFSASAAMGQNLVYNGDFELGNVGFTTEYGYVPLPTSHDGNNCNQSSLHDPNTYAIGTSPSAWHGSWASFGDHTSGSGNMMIVNATSSTCAGQLDNDVVWSQTVAVAPDRDYDFTYYVALSYPTSPPLLEVSINGVPIDTYDVPAGTAGQWYERTFTWNAGDADSAVIVIRDLDPVFSGDDYTLDDISLVLLGEACEDVVWTLWAGQTIDVGTLTVNNDEENLYVTYTLDYQNPDCPDGPVDAEFGTLHLWVGDDLALLPGGGESRPPLGQLPYQFDATGLQAYTFTIPLDEIGIQNVFEACDALLYVVAHAEVNYLDCDGNLNGDNDTAFGGDIPGDGNAWWYYAEYFVCCDGGGGGEIPFCETAFGKGGWIWTTHPRSNPENLPSLELTQNRWGWAINLAVPGETVYDIWAGAGLNDTSKGVLVGTLTVVWDGAEVCFEYDLDEGYTMQELHVYAGDDSPTTIAPGQYGYLQDFNEGPVGYWMDCVPAADTDGDGVWIVAHAVACWEE